MKITPRHIPISAAVAAVCFTFALPALGQSLALSYKLDVNEQAQRASIANAGCTAFKWVAAVAPCGHNDTLGRYTRGPQREEEPVRAAPGGELAVVPAKPVRPAPAGEADLIPLLGESAVGARSVREAPARADVSLRLGAKQRSRATDEAIEQYRFKDIAQETRVQKNNFNALGLELLVPFQ